MPDAVDKPHTPLFEAMRPLGYDALARLTMHNREHAVVLRPGQFGLILHALCCQDELRAADE